MDIEKQSIVAKNIAFRNISDRGCKFRIFPPVDTNSAHVHPIYDDLSDWLNQKIVKETADIYEHTLHRISAKPRISAIESLLTNDERSSAPTSSYALIPKWDSGECWDASTWQSNEFTESSPKIYFLVASASSNPDYDELPRVTTQQYISYIADEMNLNYGYSLANRLTELKEAVKEEYEEQSPLSKDSIETFTYFLFNYQNIEEPDIILTSEGNIRARWQEPNGGKIFIEFYADNNVKLFVISQHEDRINIPARTSVNLIRLDEIEKFLEPHNISNILFL